MIIWLPKINFSKAVCQGCILGKRPKHKYERGSHERTFAPLELIHSDIAGPFPHISMSQSKYALTFIDDFSSYCWVHFLSISLKFFTSSKYLKPWLKTSLGGNSRSSDDNGGEYVKFEFIQYCKYAGI